jgi:hypothetical protein
MSVARAFSAMVVSVMFAVAVSSCWSAGALGDEPSFGIAVFDGLASDAGGNLMSQAGGHPYQLMTAIDFNTFTDPSVGPNLPVEDAKDVIVDLPPGLVGSVAGVSECTATELANGTGGTNPEPLCPSTAQIGILTIRTDLGETAPAPVFNMAPPAGVPARFGINVGGDMILFDSSLARSAGTYHLRVSSTDVPQALAIDGNTITLWGVPSDPSHDSQRACPGQSNPGIGGPTCTSGVPAKAFFRLPTSCTGSTGLLTTVAADSWVHPGDFKHASFLSHDLPGYPAAPGSWGPQHGTDGCESVPFEPQLVAQPPAGAKAGEPTGLTVDVTIPQSDDAGTIAQADLKKAVVTLPAGVRVSPSSADGLGACTSAQIALESTEPPTCPDSSKLGTVKIETPLLDEAATGYVYLATPYDNPFDSLVAVYLVASVRGVVIKVPGQVAMDPVTGQITSTFDDNPQLPFSRLHLEFNSGARAPLVAPAACDTYTTHAVLEGWNGGAPVSSDSTFTLTENSGGPACASTFSPGFLVGTQSPVAGRFSPFALRLTRSDSDSELGSLSSLSLPKGLLADVGSISTRCTIGQADAAACPAASHIGEVTVGAGAGPSPYYVNGDVYLTTPYKGNPFGLATIVHAAAGPFDLGHVVVKAGVQVHDDGSLTTVSDPFPTILKGIPLQVRDIRINVDRPGFTLNPTNCDPLSANGTVTSTDGRSANVSNRFQVGECRSMPFGPSFKVSTSSKASLGGNGAALSVKIASKSGPGVKAGEEEANIRSVAVRLPIALPSRLSTLQKACTQAQFNSNPAGCPAGSKVGGAVAHTPILAVPLEGPAYLVSHGGAAFPDLVLVLQGEGITIHVTGHTQIDSRGYTYSRFETVPDAPISSFELRLPRGPNSALAANRNLCKANMNMPTTLVGQNGAVVKETTKIAVTGCPKAKKARKAGRHKKG